MAKRGRIRLYFEGESKDAEAAAKRTERAIGDVDDATKRYNKTAGQQEVAISKVNRRNFELTTSTRAVSREHDTLTKRLSDVNVRFTSMRNLVSLIKWPALITGAGYATEGIGALAAGTTALTSALAPLSGALAAYPALLGSVGQAAGVLALTQMGDLKEALGGNEEALKRLSPAAKDFLGVIEELEPAAKKMRSAVQEDLFDGLTKGLRRADDNFGVIQRTMRRTAGVMGNLAERAGALLGSKGFGRDLERIGEGNARMLGRMGVAGLRLSSALRHVMVAAQPFLGWLSGSVAKLSGWVTEAAAAGRESGRLSTFFGRTREVMERLASITQSLAAGLLQIGHAAAPLGRQILGALDDAAQGFETWTESIKGENALRDYFAHAKPGILEMGRLIGDLGAAFLRLSNDDGFFTLTHAIRTELVPVVEEVIANTTQAFGPHLVGALVQITKLFGHLAGSSGPLVGFVDAIGASVGVINTLLETVPGLNGLVVTLVGVAAVSKAMKFTAAVTGVTTLISLFKGLRTAALGAAAAEQAAAAPGIFGALGKRGGVKGILKSGAAAAPLGMLSGAEVAGVAGSSAGPGLLAAPAAGPWLAVAAAIAATGVGLVLLYKHSKAFRDLVAPVGKAATDAFNQVKAQLAPLGESFSELGDAFGGQSGIVGELKAFYPKVKGPLEAIGNLVKSVWLRGIQSAFNRAAEIVRGFGQSFAGVMQIVRGVVEVITGILTFRFGKAWQGVKNIFGGGVKTVIGLMRAMVSPITSAVRGIGDVLRDVFGNTWEKVKGIFEDGANAVIGFVQKIADVINLIPGVPDIDIPTFGGGGGKGKAPAGPQGPIGPQERYSGGAITRPMAIVGEEAPQHHEWVIATNPRYRKNNIGYWMQAGRDLGIPGFLSGGNIVSAAKGAVSAAGNVVSSAGSAIGGLFGKGAEFFIDKLPKPNLPKWMGSLGSYVISNVADYIRSGFKDRKIGNLVGGIPGAAPPGFEALYRMWQPNHPQWDVWQTGLLLQKLGFEVAENPHFGGVHPVHTAGSYHYSGRAIDFNWAGGGVAELSHLRSVAGPLAQLHPKDPLIEDPGGSNQHGHFAYRMGGRLFTLPGFAQGGPIRGRVSYFNGPASTTASGTPVSKPGLALNLKPGTDESGWNNPTTRGWMDAARAGHPVFGRTTIAGHTANLPIIDLGPHQDTGRAIDVTEAGVRKLGLDPSSFPTDSIGVVQILGGGGAAREKSRKAASFKFGLAQHASAISLPGLPPGELSPEAKSLPASIQGLLTQPGLSYAGMLGIGELASSLASNTKQSVFDASGKEVSADSHADDIAAAKFQKPLVQANKRRIEKRLREIAERLKKKGLSQKQRNKLVAERDRLLENLGSATTSLQGLDETINTPPDEPEDDSESKHQEEIIRQLEALVELQKQQALEKQQAFNVSQSQYAVLAQAIAAVVSGEIGGQIGLGFQTPSVAGSLASY